MYKTLRPHFDRLLIMYVNKMEENVREDVVHNYWRGQHTDLSRLMSAMEAEEKDLQAVTPSGCSHWPHV